MTMDNRIFTVQSDLDSTRRKLVEIEHNLREFECTLPFHRIVNGHEELLNAMLMFAIAYNKIICFNENK